MGNVLEIINKNRAKYFALKQNILHNWNFPKSNFGNWHGHEILHKNSKIKI